LASLERNSEHPLASAVVSYAEQNIPDYLKRKPLVDPSNFIAVTGKGVSGTVESVRVSIGNRTYTQEMVQGPFTEEIEQALIKIESAGKTGVLASVDGVVAAIIGISDAIREDSILSVQYLQEKKKVEVWMVTGDNNRTAHAVAKQIGIPIENVIAEAVPGDKLAKVKSFQQEGKVVGMVGDGINDSPALAQADVGIALGTGTDIASEAADIILVKGNVADVCTAIDLSRTIFRRIRFNYVWALLYNCLGIPIAAGVFYPLVQIRLPPTVAAAAMALSSISVVVSSLALKLYKPPKLSITNADNVA
jgi:Cu+-exporting ATPase